MAKDFKNYDVFISSPSDVTLERDTVQEAIEIINQISGSKEGFRLNPVRWEKDVSSQIGNHPQNIINEQIGDEYDIFVGVLCNRFGQETERYNSGTEEEFFRAYERHGDQTNSPEILFYFKDPRKSESPIDARQFLKVSEFKEKIGSLGIYEEFDTQESLKTMVMAGLVKAIDRLKSRAGTDSQSNSHEKSHNPVADNALINVSEFDEDIGVMELADIVFDALERFTDILDTITTATVKLTTKLKDRTDELNNRNAIGDARQDQKAVKAILEKTAAEMHRYSHILDQATPDARLEFSSALQSLQHAIIISNQDGMSSADDVKVLTDELKSLQLDLETSYGHTLSFQSTISSWPRMTSKLNQAKRRTLKSVGDLLGFISEASLNIDTTLNAIEQ